MFLIILVDLRWLVGNTLFFALVHHLRLYFLLCRTGDKFEIILSEEDISLFCYFLPFPFCKQYLARGNVAEERTTAL
jgi:hypothetical protein